MLDCKITGQSFEDYCCWPRRHWLFVRYSLQKAGHQVSVWTRDNALSKTLKLDEHESLNFPANKTQLLEQADLVLICTKSWQLQNVLEQTLAFIPLSTPIVISHNGMGAIEKAQTLLDGRPILFATTTHGALKKDAETVLHTGIGQTVIGPYSKQALNLENLAQIFDSALPNAVWQTNIKQALWNKLAINCCINPLTAIFDCKNGELDTPDSLQIIETLCDEITQVMLVEATKPIQILCLTPQNRSSKRPQPTIHQCIKTFRTKE
ncbi:2-dehydropantoate 2-reductase [Vibrio ishigakensis]|uniref:2-dehydropantoate 2-reductase n=1 Tax=Vibrio ishigakensis TaxID=1481914 RepID=A0A0B8NTR2_9VIBR|nr:2-dehydropantoate 2-reductase [Vibrio ishigakensis]